MCGHIHTAADKWLEGVHYLNSGDWVESNTAIVENWDGSMEVVEFSEFVREFPMGGEDREGVVEMLGGEGSVTGMGRGEERELAVG
jgi:hypothetical protein